MSLEILGFVTASLIVSGHALMRASHASNRYDDGKLPRKPMQLAIMSAATGPMWVIALLIEIVAPQTLRYSVSEVFSIGAVVSGVAVGLTELALALEKRVAERRAGHS